MVWILEFNSHFLFYFFFTVLNVVTLKKFIEYCMVFKNIYHNPFGRAFIKIIFYFQLMCYVKSGLRKDIGDV